jgi:16S rRNA pseudouridine516 synthase
MGCGTRSEAKKKIRSGMTAVDGIVVKQPEMKIDPAQQSVTLDGKEIAYRSYEYYMLYKPDGVVTATEDMRERTVLDLFPDRRRRDLFPVGRLDKDTVGLLLITNDGALAHRLLAPAKHVDKIYQALIDGVVTEEDIRIFQDGVDIGDDKLCMEAELRILGIQEEKRVSEIELTIREGRFHQVKRMFHAVGKEVLFLKRIQMGTLRLDDSLRPGEYRRLTKEEVAKLCSDRRKQ